MLKPHRISLRKFKSYFLLIISEEPDQNISFKTRFSVERAASFYSFSNKITLYSKAILFPSAHLNGVVVAPVTYNGKESK